MKKLFITAVLMFLIVYPPSSSQGKQKKLVETSIVNYEKIKYEALVNDFFIEAHRISKSLNKIQVAIKN